MQMIKLKQILFKKRLVREWKNSLLHSVAFYELTKAVLLLGLLPIYVRAVYHCRP